MVKSGKYDSVLSGVRLHQFAWRKDRENAYCISYNPTAQRPMRQEVGDFIENGSIYVFKYDILKQYGTRLGGRIGIFEMNENQRFEIDTQQELKWCEDIMREYVDE
jgi:N-acylneuraminate cytidylyltransferase